MFPQRSYLILSHEEYSSIKRRLRGDFSVEHSPSFILIIGKDLQYKKTTIGKRSLFFLGDFFDPHNPKLSNDRICYLLAKDTANLEDVAKKTYSLFGKWIILEDKNNRCNIVGDPHCTKSIKYHSKRLVISDLASLVAKITSEVSVLKLNKSNDHRQFACWDFQKTCWWCGNATLFPNILSLLPNHFLSHDGKKSRTYRFPLLLLTGGRRKKHEKTEVCYCKTEKLLKGFFKSLSYRTPFALTVTGGHDSRVLFAACHSSRVTANYFVSVHGNKTQGDSDIQIPQQLCQSLEVDFNIYKQKKPNSTIESKIKQFFPEIPAKQYASYNYSSYFNDDHKADKIVLGLIPEVISGYYYNRLFSLSAKGLSDIARHGGSKFSEKKFGEWLEEIKKHKLPYGYNILDLFYWEHRAGRWAAQTVNVCDLFEDLLWGFNCREFYDMWLRTPLQERAWPQRNNLIKITKRFGENYSSTPYSSNPSLFFKITHLIEKSAARVFFRELDYFYKRAKRLALKSLT